MHCMQCGKEIAADSDFCAFCGAAVGPSGPGKVPTEQPPAASESPQAPPPPPPPPGGGAPPPPATPSMGTSMQPGPYATKPKKSILPWLLGGIGLAAIIAVILVLIFVVFSGGDSASGPEKVVETFFQSLEDKDMDMFLGTMEPDFVEELEDALGKDYRGFLDEYFMGVIPDGIDFTITKFETEVKDDEAKVTVAEGTMSYIDENTGEKVTERADEGDVETFELVKINGSWYISSKTLKKTMGLDLSEFEDGYLDDDYEDLGVTLPVDSEDEVLLLILDMPEVWEWFLAVDEPLYEITDENTSYVIHLYEIVEGDGDVPGHTATFGWYAVDKDTGEVYEVME